MRYLALIRGINVGGRNLVKMADLRAAFEELGADEVTTYIASGNVLFTAGRTKRAELADRIETHLSSAFAAELKVVLLTEGRLREIVEGAPAGFGSADHLCDVIFLREPLTVRRAWSAVELRPGVDQAWPGKGVVYFARLASKASGSRLSRLAARPEYKQMTVRSWSTTQKLLAKVDEPAS